MAYRLIESEEFYLNEFKSSADKLLYIIKHALYPPAALLHAATVTRSAQVAPKLTDVSKLKTTTFLLNVLSSFIMNVIGINFNMESTALLGYDTLRQVLKLQDFPIATSATIETWYLTYWSFLHTSSIILYRRRDDKKLWGMFEFIFYLFYMLLPCGICSINFRAKPRLELIDKFHVDIIRGMFDFHNLVSASKTPPGVEMSFEDFLGRYKLEEIDSFNF